VHQSVFFSQMIGVVVYCSLLVFSLIMIGGVLFFVFRMDTSESRQKAEDKKRKKERKEEEEPRGDLRHRTALGRGRRHREMTMDDVEETSHEEAPPIEEQIAPDTPTGKIGKKKAAKLAAKAEAKRQREAMAQMREEQRERAAKKSEADRLAREEEEEKERLAEEEERKYREEMEKKKKEEYEEWKKQFAVEEEGSDALDGAAKEARTEEIIRFLKRKRVVMLEEISTLFKMRTNEVVELLQALDADNRLIGVIDDRGKFIHVEQEELEQIAKFIERRGRVSAEEIRAECNAVIQLPENQMTEEEFDNAETEA